MRQPLRLKYAYMNLPPIDGNDVLRSTCTPVANEIRKQLQMRSESTDHSKMLRPRYVCQPIAIKP
ncbi:MAG: hypothetical protein K0Q73_5334, partial [Paenibacillus sp.]|nr:hypothetical protein [Paenibacillus sp.]